MDMESIKQWYADYYQHQSERNRSHRQSAFMLRRAALRRQQAIKEATNGEIVEKVVQSKLGGNDARPETN
jgi:hypothetical protein